MFPPTWDTTQPFLNAGSETQWPHPTKKIVSNIPEMLEKKSVQWRPMFAWNSQASYRFSQQNHSNNRCLCSYSHIFGFPLYSHHIYLSIYLSIHLSIYLSIYLQDIFPWFSQEIHSRSQASICWISSSSPSWASWLSWPGTVGCGFPKMWLPANVCMYVCMYVCKLLYWL